MIHSKTAEIKLKTGEIMTIEMSPVLVNSIVELFGLSCHDEVTDKHVKYYLASSLKNALAEE